MASKDKTSKTARVMNLLSKKADPAVEEAAAEKPAAPVPPVVSSIAPDAAVSVQIKNALEDALGPVEEAPQPEPAREAAPAPQSVQVEAAPQPVQVEVAPQSVQVEAAPEPEPEPQPKPAPAPAAEQPAPEAEAPAQWEEPLHPGYINVMQVLVEEKAPKYVKMFGLCGCARCMEDVKAYTLNHLPPKYVVLEPGDRIPRLTVYEGKLSSEITAQLLQACKIVHKTPHHSRG